MLPENVVAEITRQCNLKLNQVIVKIHILEIILEDEDDDGLDEAYVAVELFGSVKQIPFHITRQTSGYVVMRLIGLPEHLDYYSL